MTSSRCSLWLDGCFDGFHYAHANAVRQARYLIPGEENPRILIGVHSDEKILLNKGPTLFDETERYNLIRGCRWVDQVVEDVPYVTQLYIIDEYHIDFVVHGDDMVLDAEGNDCYGKLKEIGRYKECKRTEGISTTSLIGRILRPDEWSQALTDSDDARMAHLLDLFVESIPPPFPKAYYAELASNTTRCETFRAWSSHKKAVYISGSWDCFGAGHVELLRRAKGVAGDDTFLIVGLWSDEVLSEGEQPLLAQLERALAVVQCRYTDAVIISAPKALPSALSSTLGIQIVVNAQGTADAGVQHLRVDEPPLQTVASLRSKLLAQLSAYQERQKRKGG